MQRFMTTLLQIVRRAGAAGIAISALGRQMNNKEGFRRALKEQRMSFRQLIDLHASSFRIMGQGNASRITASQEDATQRENLDGTLMAFQRPRP